MLPDIRVLLGPLCEAYLACVLVSVTAAQFVSYLLPVCCCAEINLEGVKLMLNEVELPKQQ